MSNRRKAQPLAPRAPATMVVAYIHPGETSAHFTTSLTNALLFDQATTRHVVGCINEWSSANVSQARNSLTARFVDAYPAADWLLWVDADMAFDHDSFGRLVSSADAAERPVVGGLCFGSTVGALFPTIYQMTRTAEGRLTTLRVFDYERDAMVPCAATGAAFLLVHRSVLEAVRDKAFNAAFPWFQETEIDGQPAGEDLTFCLRAGACGFPVHVNTAVKIGHHKSALLDEGMFLAQRAATSEGAFRG